MNIPNTATSIINNPQLLLNSIKYKNSLKNLKSEQNLLIINKYYENRFSVMNTLYLLKKFVHHISEYTALGILYNYAGAVVRKSSVKKVFLETS